MKFFKLHLFLFLFISSQTSGFAKLDVLILDGQNNHNWKSTTPVLINALEKTDLFTVTVSTSPPKKSKLTDLDSWNPRFSEFDVTLSNYNGEMWPERVRNDLVSYVKRGGAFVVVHAANNAFGNWDEYNRMIGLGGWGGRNEKSGPYLFFNEVGKVVRDPRPGRGGGHGPQHEFMVKVRNSKHPITQGMPLEWMHSKDELYDSLRGPAENVEILATAYSDKSKKHEPMIMTIAYGDGRVFHTTMGHADYSMKCVGFQDVLCRGTEWAATGSVSLRLSKKFPNAQKVSAYK